MFVEMPPSAYEKLRISNIHRNTAFMGELEKRFPMESPQKQLKPKCVNRRKRKADSTDQPKASPRKSLRHAKGQMVPALMHGEVLVSEKVRVQCVFCKIWSFWQQRHEVNAWLISHLEENATCIEIRKKTNLFEVESLAHGKEKRYLFIRIQFHTE